MSMFLRKDQSRMAGVPATAWVVGVGMTKFERPNTVKWDYPDMAYQAGKDALDDAGLTYKDIDAVVASYCYGEPTSGQCAAYTLGLTGLPIFNVNNNCSSGSSALMLARTLVNSGQYSCVMALGFEKMERGLSERFPEKRSPVVRHFDRLTELTGDASILPTMNKMTSDVIKLFAYAAQDYMKAYPSCTRDDFATIACKNREHARVNSKAMFYGRPSLDPKTVRDDAVFYDPITRHQSSMTADGSACAIVCNEKYLETGSARQLKERAVPILAQRMVTDLESSFHGTVKTLSGYEMARRAAKLCFEDAQLSPQDVDIVEVHDCFSCNELFMYEAMGLCEEGQGSNWLRSGHWTTNAFGNKYFKSRTGVCVNPSGGLEGKGHPIGATGLAQCFELVTQLRGEAKERQIGKCRVGLQHNFGIGGAAVVTIYGKPQAQGAQVSKL